MSSAARPWPRRCRCSMRPRRTSSSSTTRTTAGPRWRSRRTLSSPIVRLRLFCPGPPPCPQLATRLRGPDSRRQRLPRRGPHPRPRGRSRRRGPSSPNLRRGPCSRSLRRGPLSLSRCRARPSPALNRSPLPWSARSPRRARYRPALSQGRCQSRAQLPRSTPRLSRSLRPGQPRPLPRIPSLRPSPAHSRRRSPRRIPRLRLRRAKRTSRARAAERAVSCTSQPPYVSPARQPPAGFGDCLTSKPAASASRPITTPETMPATSPITAIISRGESGSGIDPIMAASCAWFAR